MFIVEGCSGIYKLVCLRFLNYCTFLTYCFDLGFVTDEEVQQREAALRNALKNDGQFQVKIGAPVEVAQVTYTDLNKVAISIWK